MTDRFHSLTVVLDENRRDDDLLVESLIDAIRMFKGVLDVSGNISDLSEHAGEVRARHKLGLKIWAVLYPPK